jgi:two-component sensor histidine kinase
VINDSLFIASDDGLTVIPVALIGKITTRAPIPYIRTVFVNDLETAPYFREIQARGTTKIAFTFGSVNYSSTPVLYAYQLEGVDTGWTTSISGSVVYQHLLSGQYKFKLKVGKPTAEWSDEIAIPIIIEASFWRHPFFITMLVVLCLAGLIYAIVRRKNIQIKRWEIEHQLVLLEQKALQSMMNPHFIFNSLGSIQNYLLQKKSGEAGLYLSQFARLIRQNMNAINSAMINLDEEIDRLKNYLDLERLRMEDKFEYHIEVDDNLEADDILIPSMIIQPFIENSIWHGISPMEGNGFVGVYFSMQDEHSMKVTIEDNGIGIKQAGAFKRNSEKHLHLGMEMTRKRLELLGRKYHVQTGVEFSEAFPGRENPGTLVILVIPLIYSETGK